MRFLPHSFYGKISELYLISLKLCLYHFSIWYFSLSLKYDWIWLIKLHRLQRVYFVLCIFHISLLNKNIDSTPFGSEEIFCWNAVHASRINTIWYVLDPLRAVILWNYKNSCVSQIGISKHLFWCVQWMDFLAYRFM